MRKLIAVLSLLLMMCLVASCGNSDKEKTEEAISVKDARELLKSVWDTYPEEERFAVIGGDFSEENNKQNEPGKYSIEDPEALNAALAFPVNKVSSIDDAASLVHMMNGNTFTCGVFHAIDKSQTDELVKAIKENIDNRNWICGFPSHLIISKVEEYVVVVFGDTELVSSFKGKLQGIYPQTETVYDEAIE